MAKAQKDLSDKKPQKQHKFQIIDLPTKMQVENNYGLINPLGNKITWLYQNALNDLMDRLYGLINRIFNMLMA